MIDGIVGSDQNNFKFVMDHQSIQIPVTKIKLIGDRTGIWVNISTTKEEYIEPREIDHIV